MRIPGVGRLKAFGRIFRLPQSHALILMYHRVSPPDFDPWLLCVTPQHFAEHMDQLRQHYNVISLPALRESLEHNTLPPLSVVVTFDDGYGDNLWNAKPILEHYEVPATFFITTGYIGQDRLFWWDELEELVLGSVSFPRYLQIELAGKTFQWDFRNEPDITGPAKCSHPDWKVGSPFPTGRHRAYLELHGLLMPLPHDERQRVLACLRSQINPPLQESDRRRTLTSAELLKLGQSELIGIGSHTVTHTALAGLDPDSQRWELAESKRILETALGRPVSTLSYPFGGESDVSDRTIDLTKEVGFDIACSTVARAVTRRDNLFWLPRVFVKNWNGADFHRRLEACFGAGEC